MSSTLSYVCAPVIGGYIYESVPERLKKLARADGKREAIVYYDQNLQRVAITRKQLYEKSTALAKVLINDGLKCEAKVGFIMANSINMLIANFAVVCAGGIPFFMGTNLQDGSDVIDVMNNMECETLFIDTNGEDANWNLVGNIWPLNNETSLVVPTLNKVICNGNISESHNRIPLTSLLLRKPNSGTMLPSIQPEGTLALFCSSGSTGKPKQIECSHFHMLNFTKQDDFAAKVTEKSRFFNDRTFSWSFGFPRVYLVEGATRIFIDPRLSSSRRNIRAIADIISKEECDVVYAPNYLATDLIEQRHLSVKFSSVDTIILSGERIPVDYTALKEGFCKQLSILYGTTEAGSITAFLDDNTEPFEDGIIGKPVGGAEVKIIDETGATVPFGYHGEICTRNSWRFTGYRGNEAAFNAAVDSTNWFHTGDYGHIREDGNVIFDGRQKELISMQTDKIFPWSIEQVLKKMPGAMHAFAVGVPDKRSYEVVCACVVPKKGVPLTTYDVKKYCDNVFLDESSSMVITTKPVYHVVLSSLPLLNTGKFSRRDIANIAKEKLGL